MTDKKLKGDHVSRARARTERGQGSTEDVSVIRLAHRVERVLMALYYLGTEKTHSYEDIVVSAFQHFPTEFAMRGYPQYPDSSDVHVPLYKELKTAGYVVSAPNKRFRLTAAGFERARLLLDKGKPTVGDGRGRAERATTMELRRLAGTEAARRFVEGNFETVLDTDFHEFFGTSVRSRGERDFQGRLNQVKEWIGNGLEAGVPEAKKLEEVRRALLQRFDDELVKPREG